VSGTPSVLHLVARLNVGGPAIQVIPLVDRLRARGWLTSRTASSGPARRR
jgi:hypothetical protein